MNRVTRRIYFYVSISLLTFWTIFVILSRSSIDFNGIQSAVDDFLINQELRPLDSHRGLDTLNHRGIAIMANATVTIMGAGKNVANHLDAILHQVPNPSYTLFC